MASSTKRDTAYQQAEVIARKIEDKDATAYVLSGMGDVALDRGDLTLARKRYEEALALRNQAGEKQNAAESRVSLAKLAIEEGHASDAETSVRACKQQFQQGATSETTNSVPALYSSMRYSLRVNKAKLKRKWKQLNGLETRARTVFFVYSSNWPQAAFFWPPIIRMRHVRYFSESRVTHTVMDLSVSSFADELAIAEFANKTKHGAQAQMELHALQKSASSKGFGLHRAQGTSPSRFSSVTSIAWMRFPRQCRSNQPIWDYRFCRFHGPRSQFKAKYHSRTFERLTQPCCKCLQILLTARLKRLASESQAAAKCTSANRESAPFR